jgi:hypothetical protein
MNLLGNHRLAMSGNGELEIYCGTHNALGVEATSAESGDIVYGFICSLEGEALTDFAAKEEFESFKSGYVKKLSSKTS